MRVLRSLVLVAAAGVVAATATVPASATTTYHESYTFSGVVAQGDWKSAEEPALGEPRAVYVLGADATSVRRVAGAAPERMRQPAVLAMALMMPGEGGADPVPAEWWCVSDAGFTFSYTEALDAATLDMSCTADVYVGENDKPLPGVTIPLQVSATWTAVAPLVTTRHHSRDSGDGTWSMERSRSQSRDAVAHLTVAGVEGIVFDGQLDFGQVSNTRVGTLYHES